MNDPYFTVVVPTYNRAQVIGDTLLSVKQQTFTDFECIIIDDGSDDADELDRAVEKLNDDRFRVIHQANGGGGAARNAGIEQAAGRHIAFLDSDDKFLPNKLSIFHARLEQETTTDCAYYSFAHVDRGVAGKTWIRPDRAIGDGEAMADYLFVANQFVQTSTIVMPTELARAVMFDPALRKGQDLDFCVRADAAGIRFKTIEEPLIIWIDISEVGRTSRQAGASAPQAWLDSHADIMSPRAVLGYRATVLSYYQPKYKLPIVLYDVVNGVISAGVPAKVAARHLLRFCLPRRLYRSLVSLTIRARGQKS